ncbi:MAG TPA: TcpE family conjugal transfer membrane protein [Symbiobacteriaceae bacterium]|nr:TcpE family conjugal transfer membrane protein [Symbiobacteriaceae bacterium]
MTEDRLRLRTYSQVWRLERMIYRIERVPLPVPVTFGQVGVFVAATAAMAALSRLAPVAALSPAIRYLLIPGLITWFLTRQSLDGRPPHLWLLTMAAYLFSPRRLGGYNPLPRPQQLRVRVRVACRRGSPEQQPTAASPEDIAADPAAPNASREA